MFKRPQYLCVDMRAKQAPSGAVQLRGTTCTGGPKTRAVRPLLRFTRTETPFSPPSSQLFATQNCQSRRKNRLLARAARLPFVTARERPQALEITEFPLNPPNRLSTRLSSAAPQKPMFNVSYGPLNADIRAQDGTVVPSAKAMVPLPENGLKPGVCGCAPPSSRKHGPFLRRSA